MAVWGLHEAMARGRWPKRLGWSGMIARRDAGNAGFRYAFWAVDIKTGPLRVKRNMPGVLVLDALWGWVIFRSYPRHKYLIVKPLPFRRTVFDWWPNDRGDRLRVFGFRVLR